MRKEQDFSHLKKGCRVDLPEYDAANWSNCYGNLGSHRYPAARHAAVLAAHQLLRPVPVRQRSMTHRPQRARCQSGRNGFEEVGAKRLALLHKIGGLGENNLTRIVNDRNILPVDVQRHTAATICRSVIDALRGAPFSEYLTRDLHCKTASIAILFQ